MRNELISIDVLDCLFFFVSEHLQSARIQVSITGGENYGNLKLSSDHSKVVLMISTTVVRKMISPPLHGIHKLEHLQRDTFKN